MAKRERAGRRGPVRAEDLTSVERLNALCSAARKAGISYGNYLGFLTAEEEYRIYVRYAKLLEKRRIQKIDEEKEKIKQKASNKLKVLERQKAVERKVNNQGKEVASNDKK